MLKKHGTAQKREKWQLRANPSVWSGRFSYATCAESDGRLTVFAADVTGIGSNDEAILLTNRAIEPLAEFGCHITQSIPPTQPRTSVPRTQPPPHPFLDQPFVQVQRRILHRNAGVVGSDARSGKLPGKQRRILHRNAGARDSGDRSDR